MLTAFVSMSQTGKWCREQNRGGPYLMICIM